MRSPRQQSDFLEDGRFGESKRPTPRSKAMIAVAILVGLAATGSSRIYAISEGSGGFALWNASEAYFFVEVNYRGYNASGLQLPWIFFKGFIIGGLAAAEFPKDALAYLDVIRVNSSGAERHVLKLADRADGGAGSDPKKFTPLEGRIYASCPLLIGHFTQFGHEVANSPNDGLCWWAGDHFEKATQEEGRRLGGIQRLSDTDFENDENGWSRRVFVAERPGRKFTAIFGEKLRLSMTDGAKGIEAGAVSIELVLPGKAPERIADFESRDGVVTKSRYERTFRRHD